MSLPAAHDAPLRPRRFSARSKFALGGVSVVLLALLGRLYIGTSSVEARDPAPARAAAPAQPAVATPNKQNIVAMVNGEEITRDQLAKDALRHYGKEVLESVLNKHLIADYCKQRGVTITKKEIDDEIERMARKFNLPVDQWVKMLKQERGIKPEQYAQDIIWPTVALRKLAASRLTVTDQELQKAFEAEFGPSVKARLIVVEDLATARQVQAKAAANPDDFGNLARRFSKDTNSASINGMIQPIRRHVGDPQIEQVAFQMHESDVSPVIQVGEQYVILKCEGHLPARAGVNAELVKTQLTESIRDRKLRSAAAEVFQQLQKEAKIENVFNDPAKRAAMPGVAATLNGNPISLRELGDECVERHGTEILEAVITRRLLEQAVKTRQLTITQDDINAEIARAAIANNKVKPSGEADVEGWLEHVKTKQNVSTDMYVYDAVWPSAALKKLVGEVPVTPEDLQRGYEANYGPRVRARAIVMNNQRKAQEVWERARSTPTPEFFGQLAEQYSVEAASKANSGRIPPIPRHGGNPAVEKEAFSLKAGDLSSVICIGDKFIILFCEGYTEPTKVSLAEVQHLIMSDIEEKKSRIAMSEAFEQLKEAATIDNYLAGTTQSPKKVAAANGAPGKLPGNPAARPVATPAGRSAAPATATPGLRQPGTATR